jgi:hypothetical protein
MAFWIFKYKPQIYRLAERLADPNPDLTWPVSRFRKQIAPGDTIFVWETGRNRGIRAILRAEGVPHDMAELESEQPYNAERDTTVRCRVRATIVRRDVNLSDTELRSVPGLENLSIFHGFQQGTNFPVTPDEGAILLRLASRTARQADDKEIPPTPRVWWCNQTRCWDDERPAGLVCSHIAATEGGMKYRRMVGEVRAGDITVHYRSGRWLSVIALSRAVTDAVEGTVDLRQYGVTGKVCWEVPGPGWRFEADYYDLADPIPKSAFIEELNEVEIAEGPLVSSGQIRQAYFMRFTIDGLRILRRASTQDWPEWAEAVLSSYVPNPDYFYFNTDSRSLVGSPRFHKLINGGFAATSGDRSYGEQLGQLAPGDILLMYENNIGAVAVGTVLEPWDGKSHSSLRYYVSAAEIGEDGHEYGIKVDWFLDLSENPIGIQELRERVGFISPKPIQKIVKATDEVARMIAERLSDESGQFPDEIPADAKGIVEGAKKRIWVNAYERREVARRKCIEAHG